MKANAGQNYEPNREKTQSNSVGFLIGAQHAAPLPALEY